MNMIPIFVGIDYHQSTIQVCIMDQDGEILANKSCSNHWQSIVVATEGYGQVQRVAIESCTGSADLAEELVQLGGWSVNLAHPGYVSRMRQNPDKHDWGDARLLADLIRVGYLPKVWLAPQHIRALRRVVRYRQQLVEERRSTKLRIRGILRDERSRCTLANPWTRGWWSWLKENDEIHEQSRWVISRLQIRLEMIVKEIQVVETRLQELTCKDPVVQRLRKQPGIGPVTAWILRAEIGRFDRFRTGKQLSRFCGLSPRNASSGSRQADAGLVKACNSQLRSVLMQTAHRLIRHDQVWSELATRLLNVGKPKNVAVAAVGNRWMRWLFHQMQPANKAA